MLHDGKLVGVIADVVQQTGEQHRADVAAADAHRPEDGVLALLAGHPGHEILSAIDRLRQTLELRAVSEKIGAHGEHNVDRVRRLRGPQQKVHQRGGLFIAGRNPTEKFATP